MKNTKLRNILKEITTKHYSDLYESYLAEYKRLFSLAVERLEEKGIKHDYELRSNWSKEDRGYYMQVAEQVRYMKVNKLNLDGKTEKEIDELSDKYSQGRGMAIWYGKFFEEGYTQTDDAEEIWEANAKREAQNVIDRFTIRACDKLEPILAVAGKFGIKSTTRFSQGAIHADITLDGKDWSFDIRAQIVWGYSSSRYGSGVHFARYPFTFHAIKVKGKKIFNSHAAVLEAFGTTAKPKDDLIRVTFDHDGSPFKASGRIQKDGSVKITHCGSPYGRDHAYSYRKNYSARPTAEKLILEQYNKEAS